MKNKVVNSSLLSSGAQILSKTLGLISTLILARVLTPNDFGLIAIVSTILYFFSILSTAGTEQYLIRKKTINKSDLYSAWTLDLIVKLVMALIMISSAPFITSVLYKPELTFPIQVASIVLILNALHQPKLVYLKRQLNYNLLFKLTFFQKLFSFVVLLTLAINLKNFWAFILADIFASLFLLFASYVAINEKPQLTLIKFSQQWMFSKWLLGKNILGYLRSQIDLLVVSRFFPTALIGNYSMAKDFAMLPGHHILAPAIEPLLASFKKNKHNPSKLKKQFFKAHAILSLMASPISIFLAFNSELAVEVLFGSQWVEAKELLSILAWLFFYWVHLLLLESLLLALDKIKTLFFLDLISLTITVASLLAAYWFTQKLEFIAIIRVTTGVILTTFVMLIAHFLLTGIFRKYLIQTTWPLVISLTVAFGVNQLSLYSETPILNLLINGFAFLFIVTSVFLFTLLKTPWIEEHAFILSSLKLLRKFRFGS